MTINLIKKVTISRKIMNKISYKADRYIYILVSLIGNFIKYFTHLFPPEAILMKRKTIHVAPLIFRW